MDMPAIASLDPIHPQHAANMAAKALRFVTFLRANGAQEIPAALAHLAEHENFAEQAEASWSRITEMVSEATSIDETVPGDATRAVIVTLLQNLPPAEADPFAGLGGF